MCELLQKLSWINENWFNLHIPLFFRHGTARLHLSFCRPGLKIGTGLSTGVARVSHTDFFHSTARLSVFTCGKAGTADRGAETTYLVVLGTAKNLGTVYTVTDLPCRAEKQRHPYQNISRGAVPKTV